MGTSPDLGVSEARCTMRAFVFVLLAAVAVNAEAEADAYTIGQVAHGLTNGGVVTGVDYSNGVVSGYGAIGNRPISHVAGVYNAHPVNTVAGVYNTHPVNTVAGVYNTLPVHNVAGVYNAHHVTPAVYSNVYSGLNHLYGKREADAEPEAEAEPYTIGQIHAGLPVVNAIATGHAHNVGVTHAVPTVHAGVYNAHHAIATPAVNPVAGVYNAHPVNTVAGVYNTPAVHNVAGVYNAHHVTPA